MSNLSNLRLLRSVLKELKHISNGRPVNQHPLYPVISDQYHRYETTELKVCRGENEARHLAQTYLCLLTSIRRSQELSALYSSSEEKSTEEAANLVGLTLPQQPDGAK